MAPTSGDFRKLVAHEIRWHLLEELAKSDRTVQELVERSGRRPNLVSYHLGKLRRGGLVSQHRSAADARDLYYQFGLDRFTDLYMRSGAGVQPAFALVGPLMARLEGIDTAPTAASAEPWRVLFVCTGNSARSQMAEAFTRELSNGALAVLCHGPVEAESAGTAPRPVHPMAIRVMNDLGTSIATQRSKSLEQLRDHRFDQVITLCDVAREACPPIPGIDDPPHWSLPDPAAVAGSEEEVYEAFRATALAIAARVRQMLVRVGAARVAAAHAPA
jgi:protein-tyrosine-phosphatase/DNA-binding transcriptional ArsR family regulator